MGKHKNLAIFIPHAGCPHQCSFCDQRAISGTKRPPSAQEVKELCKEMLERGGDFSQAEIAFFGGSFTAVEEAYQNELLEAVQEFLGKDKFQGIRISTRPDCIDAEILTRLKSYHVRAIELGSQSMDDRVLEWNHRGHSAEAVKNAAEQIKSFGFSLGLQMMTGLYGSTLEESYHTLEQLLALKPDTLRIYPTVILKGTELEQRMEDGVYPNISMDNMLDFCADALLRCQEEQVSVIRMGLHDEESMKENMVGGYFHPAMRELAESRIYGRKLIEFAKNSTENCLYIECPKGEISKVVGHKKCNRERLAQMGKKIVLKENPDLQAFSLVGG